MKTRISKIIALAALMLPAAAGMQAQDAGMSVEGSSYYLPQTALRFALQIEKSTYTPGEFAGYASRYLKRNDVSLSPSTTYRIVGLKLTSVAQPDTAKFFTAKADAKHSIRSNSNGSPDAATPTATSACRRLWRWRSSCRYTL